MLPAGSFVRALGPKAKAELKQILVDDSTAAQQVEDLVDQMIAECDTDGDGVISFSEFQAMMEKPSMAVAL